MPKHTNTGINKQSRPRREKKAPAAKAAPIARSKSRATGRSFRPTTRGNTLLNDMAPASVSKASQHNISYSAVTVNGQTGLRVSANIPLCQIGSDPQGNALQIVNSAGTSSFVTAIGLGPYSIPNASRWNASANVAVTNNRWISPHIPLLSIAFDRFRMVSMGLNYEPQATATLEDRLTLAWTDDPAHPFLSPNGMLATSATQRTQLDLLVTKDSVAFMPWKPWSLRLPVATDARFLYDAFATTSTSSTSRFSQFGSIACISAVPPTSSSLTYGILYINCTIDLFDPVPITHGGALTAVVHQHKLALLAQQLRLSSSVDDEKVPVDRQDLRSLGASDGDEFESVAPPRFTPLPSTAPGTPGFRIGSSPPDSDFRGAGQKVPSRK